jgi:lipooligosaccharide transport system ATP-binding protein
MKTVIQASDLSKRYNGREVVKSINFSIAERECFGFLGPNGAGKTTTMNMIDCYCPPSGGKLAVLGMDVTRYARRIKARLGVVPQENNLDPDLTVYNNLLVYARYFGIAKRIARQRTDELLNFVQLTDRAKDKVPTLSGGMKRRLLIARALMNEPELIILDEPTTGLDPQARHLIWQKLRGLKGRGVTMVLTTHYMEEAAQLCDRLVIMDQGRILTEGAPKELVEKHVTKEVVELRLKGEGDEIVARLKGLPFSWEKAGDTLFLYSDDGNSLLKLIMDLKDVEFLHRHAALEDVFLKLTGRDLRE